MKRNILLKTNLLICAIVIIGFVLTALLSYQANYSQSIENIEQVSTLASEGIYQELSSILSKPVNISQTMANDSLLRTLLTEESDHLKSNAYIDTIREYLETYRSKYGYDSVFLVSAATKRYYNFQGLDRTLTKDNPENDWYYTMAGNDEEYSLNVDNDEVASANNEITIFVNCKVKDASNNLLGVVGVGLRIADLRQKLLQYEEEFGVNAFFINRNAEIELSADYNGYEKKSLFQVNDYDRNSREKILSWKNASGKVESFWSGGKDKSGKKDYVVNRYIPELDWSLVVDQNTGKIIKQIRMNLIETVLIIILILAIILIVLTRVVKSFNRKIMELTEERQQTFRKVTEQLYENIYELNITKNCAAGASTVRYFESLGVPKNMMFDEALKVVAEKQIKEEFRQGYIDLFAPKHVMEEFEKGNSHLCYDFMISENGTDYFWMRIDANIYYSPEDACVHMFTYRRNIDQEKRQEIHMAQRVETDEMTGLYNKTSTRQHIEQLLKENTDQNYAFVIFDIDNFKLVNDRYGHAAGDCVICAFAKTIQSRIASDAFAGRIGGDEFVAFMPFREMSQLQEKIEDLSQALDRDYVIGNLSLHSTASIGAAAAPKDGADFDTLYRNADAALYQTKERGKNGFTIY